MEFIITAVSLLFLFANVVEVHAGDFDVTKYGAKDGANADISQVKV